MPTSYYIYIFGNLPQGLYNFTIKFFYSDLYEGGEEHALVDFDGFSIGTKEPKEIYSFPGEFNLKFKVLGDNQKWFNVLNELKKITCTVQVHDPKGYQIFSGYVYNGNDAVRGDKKNQTITVKVVDQSYRYKTVDPRTNPYGYNLNAPILITELIADILDHNVHFPFVEEVVSTCTYEAEATFSGGSAVVPFSGFGIYPYRYFNPNSPYENVLAVLKQLLKCFGCYGYVGIDRKYHIVPRLYSGQTAKLLRQRLMGDKFEPEIIPKLRGIQVYVSDGSISPLQYEETSRGAVEKNADGSLKYPEEVEVLRIEQAVGTLPGGGAASNLFLWNGSEWATAIFNRVRRKNPDGSYTAYTALWKITADDAWEIVKNDRLLFKIEAASTDNRDLISDYSMSDFYQLEEFPDKILKPRHILYNLNKGRAEILAEQAGEDPYTDGGAWPYEEPENPTGTLSNGHVYNEIIIPGADARLFPTDYKFKTGTTKVFMNGKRLTLVDDYVEIGDQALEFVDTPADYEKILLDYELLS